MSIRKLAVSVVCAFLLDVTMFTMNCSAQISQNQLSLGGIPLKSTLGYVEYIYGNPTRITDIAFGTVEYSNSVKMGLFEGRVEYITVTANNGWKTPRGLRVGMTANDAIRMYGDPDKSEARGNKRVYIYFVDIINRGSGHLGLCFDNNTKKITKLNAIRATPSYDEYYPGWLDGMFE